MTDTLSPREIQSRIRAGESVADVAAESDVPPERIQPFADPVLAERAHIAHTALAAPLRRAGDVGHHRPLRQVIGEALVAHGVDAATLQWDAWRIAERAWIVQTNVTTAPEPLYCEFLYDQRGRYSTARSDDARVLTGERPGHGGPPAESPDDDAEPTVDFSDEFAIVHAVGAEAPPNPAPEPPVDPEPDAGAYDVLPGQRSDLETLYDIFHTMSEDSVEIYPGLDDVRPIGASTPPVPVSAAPESPAEPEQDALPDIGEPAPEAPKRKKRRAAVPSWDEIMFGGPTGGDES